MNYIADFFCKELKLVIETDGATHLDENVKRKDKEKQNDLTAHGYTVLRFEDVEVVGEPEKVREKIESWIKDFENKYPEVVKKKVRNRRS